MKKSYLILAAVAGLFASCSQEVLVDENATAKGNDLLIAFDTWTEHATRSENSSAGYTWNLEDHHNAFKVWGYKNTESKAVFDGEAVTYDGTATTGPASKKNWFYTDNRYWDKAATSYHYYACAPYASTPLSLVFDGVTGTSSVEAAKQANGYFTIASAYTKVGENVSPKNATTAVESWTDAGAATDVDLMIAADCPLSGTSLTTAYTDGVTLNFIHILSRFNITLKTTDDFSDDATPRTKDKIVVNSITVGHMNNSGTFNESSASGNTLSNGTNVRWTASGDQDFVYTLDQTLNSTATYCVETLVMPQLVGVEDIALDGTQVTGNTETKAYIAVDYTISNAAGTKSEHYVAYYNLATLFGKTGTQTLAFNEGWVNTLNITISPVAIYFDATVAEWAPNETADKTII